MVAAFLVGEGATGEDCAIAGQVPIPFRQDLFAFVCSNQRFVSGLVRVKLYRGKATVVGRKSEHSLYSKRLATYETGDQFDHDAARGFIRLHGLGQQTQAERQLLKGGKGFDLPGLMRPGR